MASVRTPSTPATDAPDTVTQHLQSAHFSTAFPASVEETVDHQRNTESIPIRSLFGPFPNSADSSRADQEEGQVPEQPSSDQIATTGQNQYATRSATLNQNPSDREPWSPAEYDEPETRDDPPLPPLMKEKTAPAIGPATDKPTAVPKEIEMEGPVLYITLLLSSTGARHPYKLDEKYLRKRNVIVEGNNPINISLYKLKELILRDWREGENSFWIMLWQSSRYRFRFADFIH